MQMEAALVMLFPLVQLQVLMDLIPHFGAKADNRLTMEFWLNKHFEKELLYGF
jgi:hypothetical protein